VAGTYVEVSLTATSETEEALCDFLFSEGALGLVTEEVPGEAARTRIRASFGAGLPVDPLRDKLARYRLALAALGLPVTDGTIQVRELPIEDWGHNWKQHFTPLPVGRGLLIAPPWEAGPLPPDRLVIRVEPAMATLLIIKFMWNWNEFFWPLVVVNSPRMRVVTLGLMSFTNMYFIEYNLLTAAAVISVLPILVIFLTLQKWVVQAVVMSGLKG